MTKCEIGLIGLSVMGGNLALNIAENGFNIAVHNRSSDKIDTTVANAKKQNIQTLYGFKKLEDFVENLQSPRIIILLVKAGKAVDHFIDLLCPLLAKGDIIIDGGNEWYQTTQARVLKAEKIGIHYMGMGISGGEEGARHGPALMPGGSKDAYEKVKHILNKVAAKGKNEPCVSYIGAGGAGHYVKMVHNGIEYGDMELIAETYSILKHLGRCNNQQISNIFKKWNTHEHLRSFLIEITANIFLKKDESHPEKDLVDQILDVAGSKGTGMWTVQEAARRGCPCPTIQAALDVRYISAKREDRIAAEKIYSLQKKGSSIDTEQLLDQLGKALFLAKVCSYSQGLSLLKQASLEENWNVNIRNVVKGWRAGCIIRAELLDLIYEAFDADPNLNSLLLSSKFQKDIILCLPALKEIVQKALGADLPIPGFASTLTYINTFCNGKLPVNLIQAQRDYFGGHTVQRIDTPNGVFHYEWAQM